MKTNPTFAVFTRLQALGLVAAILSPGMVLAKPGSTALADSPKGAVVKPRSIQKAGTSDLSTPSMLRFNAIDGEPIK